MQQIAQRHSVRAVPFQVAFARAAAQPMRQLNLVLHQAFQNAVQSPPALELIKNERDRRLGLFVGIF